MTTHRARNFSCVFFILVLVLIESPAGRGRFTKQLNPFNSFSARFMMANPASSFSVKLQKARIQSFEVLPNSHWVNKLHLLPQAGRRRLQLELGDQGLFFVNK